MTRRGGGGAAVVSSRLGGGKSTEGPSPAMVPRRMRGWLGCWAGRHGEGRLAGARVARLGGLQRSRVSRRVRAPWPPRPLGGSPRRRGRRPGRRVEAVATEFGALGRRPGRVCRGGGWSPCCEVAAGVACAGGALGRRNRVRQRRPDRTRRGGGQLGCAWAAARSPEPGARWRAELPMSYDTRVCRWKLTAFAPTNFQRDSRGRGGLDLRCTGRGELPLAR